VKQGCQIFLGQKIPKTEKYTKLPQTIYQKAVNYPKWPENIPNGHKILQHFLFQDPPNFTKTIIFGLKTNHLATLLRSRDHSMKEVDLVMGKVESNARCKKNS
jgi:hypothetical protein